MNPVRTFFLAYAILATLLTACGNKKDTEIFAEKPVVEPQKEKVTPPENKFAVTRFPTAAEAFSYLLQKTSPKVVGIGEIHQNQDTVETRSALVRFTEDMLSLAAGRTADLIVETWVSTGRCGEAEQKVTREVDEVTQRPAETEDETVRLLKAAVTLNIQPHVLEMSCDDYRRVYEADGGTDYLLLLETVGRHLGQKALTARAARLKAGEAAKPATIIYGGALHNDANPSELWKDVSFGPSLVSAVGAEHYLELDLIVPEFAAASTVLQQEPWMPTVRAAAAPDTAALIRLTDQSYILVFPVGVLSKK